MSEKETLEANQLIALFNDDDGYWQVWEKGFYKPLWATKYKSKSAAEQSIIDNADLWGISLKTHEAKLIPPDYHEDWNALIPIVTRIGVISFEDGCFDKETHYYPVTFGMIGEESGMYMFRFKKFGLFKAETLIEATWLAVIDFIKFHNQQSK